MGSFSNLKQRYEDYMFEHSTARNFVDIIVTSFIAIFSAFLFAYSFRAFIVPDSDLARPLITGGASGISQIITLLLGIMNLFPEVEPKTFQAIFYIILNIPLFFLGYSGVGKRFAIFSFINVVLTSLFIQMIPTSWLTLIDISNDMLGRALFAGFISGLSSAICYKAEISAGGLDVVTYYIANNKSTSVGKYAVAFNAVIVTIFTIISIISDGSGLGALNSFLYTLVYFFTSSRVIDALNLRNRKSQMQIITSKQNMAKLLLANFPHGCTVVSAKGGFSGEERLIIYMVVSSFEVKKVVKLVRNEDSNSFIDVSDSHQVYGRFFIKPIK
jgi:uncharacterized membrane-anchored protein YitT (DUF2179 family)